MNCPDELEEDRREINEPRRRPQVCAPPQTSTSRECLCRKPHLKKDESLPCLAVAPNQADPVWQVRKPGMRKPRSRQTRTLTPLRKKRAQHPEKRLVLPILVDLHLLKRICPTHSFRIISREMPETPFSDKFPVLGFYVSQFECETRSNASPTPKHSQTPVCASRDSERRVLQGGSPMSPSPAKSHGPALRLPQLAPAVGPGSNLYRPNLSRHWRARIWKRKHVAPEPDG